MGRNKTVEKSNKIITIGRQFGSGGREFGRRLAEELGIAYYDKEIIKAIAEHTSLSEDYVKQIIEKKPHTIYPISVGQSLFMADTYYMRQVQEVYRGQSKIIEELADKSDCVIVGRCADYILRDKNPHRVFIYADMNARVKRCLVESKDKTVTEKQMRKQIESVDKNRASYYSYYTGLKWGDINNYDLCVNTTGVDIKEIVPHLAKIF